MGCFFFFFPPCPGLTQTPVASETTQTLGVFKLGSNLRLDLSHPSLFLTLTSFHCVAGWDTYVSVLEPDLCHLYLNIQSTPISKWFITNANFCWLYRYATDISRPCACGRRTFGFGVSTTVLLCLFSEKVSIRAWPDRIYDVLLLNVGSVDNWCVWSQWAEKRLRKKEKLMCKHKKKKGFLPFWSYINWRVNLA